MTVSLSKTLYIGQILLPLMRFVLVLKPALSNTTRSRRLSFFIISAVLTSGRIITGLSRLAFGALLVSGDGGLAGPDNPGLEPSKTTCDH